MTALSMVSLNWILPIAVLLGALVLGPLPMFVRGVLRRLVSPQSVRKFYRPVTLGLGLGMLGSALIATSFDSNLTATAVLLCLLFILAGIDWQWRWLPIEWTIAVIILGAIHALQSSDPLRVFVQMAVPAGALLLTRQTVLWVIKKEALGLGDIWLVAGLGAYLAPFNSFLLIGFAAFSGLVEIGIRRLLGQHDALKHAVSYGTHLCIIFVVLRNFASLG